jgi:type II secretory pathway pseudopilin PulG
MNKRRPASVFTMIELLVSTAVLSVMVVMLVGLLDRTAASWTAGVAQTERRQSARVLADSIANELRCALLPTDSADVSTLQLTLNPAAVPATFRNPDAVFWQAPLAADRRLGDIAELGYFLKWQPQPDGSVRPLFCRFYVDPTDADNFLIYKKPTQWLSAAILETVAPATRASAYRGLFAENIIGFWVRCFDKDHNVILPRDTYDSRTKKTLRSIRVSLVLLDAAGLQRLNKVPDYTTAGTGNEPDLESFIAALPNGVRQGARSMSAEVRIENSP